MNKYIFLICFFISSVFAVYTLNDNTGDHSQNQTAQQNRQMNGYDYYIRGDYNRSVQALLQEKQQFPDRPNIYVILAWDYRELKKYNDMENISIEGLKIAPSDIRIVRNLAEAYFYQNKFQLALDKFSNYIQIRSIQNDNYNSSLYYYMGVCHYELGNYNRADIALSTSLYYQRGHYPSLISIAMTKEKLNEIESSLQYYNLALTARPGDRTALESINRLKNM